MPRPRKPTHLKIVTGTLRPGRQNPREPQPKKGLPAAPSHMTAGGRRAWRYIGSRLNRMGILTEADAIALERLCETYAQILQAQESYARPITGTRLNKRTGETEEYEIAPANSRYYETHGQTGVTLRERPELSAIRSADQMLRSYLSEFGMTPASRSRVNVLPDKGQLDPASKYFD
jgi:P27 family predicted phage terminase small subunit